MNSLKRSIKHFVRKKMADPISLFPGLLQYVGYGVGDFGADFLGGITMFFIQVPQSLAYAELAACHRYMASTRRHFLCTFMLYLARHGTPWCLGHSR